MFIARCNDRAFAACATASERAYFRCIKSMICQQPCLLCVRAGKPVPEESMAIKHVVFTVTKSALQSLPGQKNAPITGRFQIYIGIKAERSNYCSATRRRSGYQENHQRSAIREPSICHRLPIVPVFASLLECAST